MIHKKKPILLISVAGAVGLVLLGLNMSQFFSNQDRFIDIPAPDIATHEKFMQRDSNTIGVGGSMIAELKEAVQLDASEDAITIADVPERPSVLLPNMRYYDEPYVDGNTTSAGWYNENSYQQTESDKRLETAGLND